MSRPEVRIGDREREAALTALGEHYAAGRITKDEYDERSGVIWAARTNAQLWPVFADLPGPHQSTRSMARPTGGPAGWGPQPAVRVRRGPRFPFLPLLLVIIGVAMVVDAFWPVLIVVGVLWWAGAFRWLHRACNGGRTPGRRPA